MLSTNSSFIKFSPGSNMNYAQDWGYFGRKYQNISLLLVNSIVFTTSIEIFKSKAIYLIHSWWRHLLFKTVTLIHCGSFTTYVYTSRFIYSILMLVSKCHSLTSAKYFISYIILLCSNLHEVDYVHTGMQLSWSPRPQTCKDAQFHGAGISWC